MTSQLESMRPHCRFYVICLSKPLHRARHLRCRIRGLAIYPQLCGYCCVSYLKYNVGSIQTCIGKGFTHCVFFYEHSRFLIGCLLRNDWCGTATGYYLSLSSCVHVTRGFWGIPWIRKWHVHIIVVIRMIFLNISHSVLNRSITSCYATRNKFRELIILETISNFFQTCRFFYLNSLFSIF